VKQHRAALALGSNLGDRLALLQAGVRDLLATETTDLVAFSSVYETEPVGGPEQGLYLNAVIVVNTLYPPRAVLGRALEVEYLNGRERSERWAPRTLDVDVLSIDEEISDEPTLTLPHPRAHERAFVLVPWAEADPTYVVPGLDRTVVDLRDALPAGELAGVHRIDAALLTRPTRLTS
jgi:2-amino-4-hydroxy-6-hydroxymethyldihydropteridine diphosphokinase